MTPAVTKNISIPMASGIDDGQGNNFIFQNLSISPNMEATFHTSLQT